MYLTPGQLTSVRTRPHRTRLWLGIYKPVTVFSAQINMPAIAKGERAITVTSISGDPAVVIDGMTCYYSISQDGKDLGRIRVRAATATTITLAENSINWSNSWYLTIVRYFEPWTVMPRIVLDNDYVPSFYKDYDIAYSDQNEHFDPIVCMGPHHAGFILSGVTGTHQVWYTSSGSYDPTPGGGIDSYDWAFEGGNPSGSTAADPGLVTYTGCGHYTTSLEITTGDAKTFTGYRHIQILTKPDSAVPGCLPIAGWGLKSLEGDRDSGGYSAGIWVRQPIDIDDIVDGSLCVIFSEDWEGTQETKVGANAENRDSTLFVGYIIKDSIRYDAVTSVVEFDVESPLLVMEEASTIFTAILDDMESPSTWNQIQHLTMDRALVHFLRWHSTLLSIADFSPTGDTKNVKSQVFSGQNIYEVCNSMMESSLLAQIVSDRQGKAWVEIDANVMPTGSARMATGSSRTGTGHMQDVISMSRQDWRSEISITRQPSCELAYLEMGGIAYPGIGTGTFEPFLSGAPGVAPDYHGGIERYSGLVLAGQDGLNETTGNAWARRNAIYPIVSIPLAGDYRFLDIAPQQRVILNVEESDTWRGVIFDEKPFIPQVISYDWNPGQQVLLMDMDLREETYGYPADSVIIPTDPPWDNPRLPPWEIDFPPIIPPDPWVPPITPPPGGSGLVYVLTDSRLVRSRNFSSAFPHWEDVSLTGTAGGKNQFYLNPFDQLNSAYIQRGGWIWKTTNLNSDVPTWTQVYSVADYQSCWPGRTDGCYVCGISPLLEGLIYTLHKGGYMCRTIDDGANWVACARPQTGDANPDHGFKILPSHHSPTVVFVLDGHQSRIYKSWTMGSAWQDMTTIDNSVTDFDVPFHDNPGDNRWAYADLGNVNQANTDRMLFTDDDRLTKVSFTPWWDSNAWGVKRGDPIPLNYQIKSHPSGYAWAMMLNRSLAEPHDVQSALWYWPNGILAVGSRELRHVFVSFCAPLTWHPTNIDYLYTLGTVADGYILSSDDGGWNWTNKFGDYETSIGTIGAPDNLGWHRLTILVVPTT